MPHVYCCEQIVEPQDGKPGSLHAKCIAVDDQQVFVSSASFTEAGQDRNIEVGLLVRLENESQCELDLPLRRARRERSDHSPGLHAAGGTIDAAGGQAEVHLVEYIQEIRAEL
jgi:phosphatidylserine/phosphatidylglycerophosphate/cardiolipin synthase-like enzyme